MAQTASFPRPLSVCREHDGEPVGALLEHDDLEAGRKLDAELLGDGFPRPLE